MMKFFQTAPQTPLDRLSTHIEETTENDSEMESLDTPDLTESTDQNSIPESDDIENENPEEKWNLQKAKVFLI